MDARANQYKVNHVLLIEVFTDKNLAASNVERGEKGTGTGGRHFDPFAFSVLEELRLEVVFAADCLNVSDVVAKQWKEEGESLLCSKAPFVQNVCPE